MHDAKVAHRDVKLSNALLFAAQGGGDATHHDTRDGASLMSAKMVSRQEHFAGGQSGDGATDPILALHSKDGGGTYVDEGAASGIVGHMITSMDFASGAHGYATTINSLQMCSLLEYGSA